jgi:nicotinamide-nucleotide adenylyltransferase
MVFDALFIGRFQPFHNGHLHALRDILNNHKTVLIALGSADKSNLWEYPLTNQEREQIILNVLNDEKISSERYKIVTVVDIDKNELWVSHLEKNLPAFKKVYTGSKIVRRLFEDDKNHDVLAVDFLNGVSGTKVREAAFHGEDIFGLVPNATYEFLKKIEFGMRLINLYPSKGISFKKE